MVLTSEPVGARFKRFTSKLIASGLLTLITVVLIIAFLWGVIQIVPSGMFVELAQHGFAGIGCVSQNTAGPGTALVWYNPSDTMSTSVMPPFPWGFGGLSPSINTCSHIPWLPILPIRGNIILP